MGVTGVTLAWRGGGRGVCIFFSFCLHLRLPFSFRVLFSPSLARPSLSPLLLLAWNIGYRIFLFSCSEFLSPRFPLLSSIEYFIGSDNWSERGRAYEKEGLE